MTRKAIFLLGWMAGVVSAWAWLSWLGHRIISTSIDREYEDLSAAFGDPDFDG